MRLIRITPSLIVVICKYQKQIQIHNQIYKSIHNLINLPINQTINLYINLEIIKHFIEDMKIVIFFKFYIKS